MTTKSSNMNKPARTRGAILYTRVSTGEQDKHGTSPESQLAACRAKALVLSLPIIAEYYDGGVSGGFLLARPGMQAALADIKAGRADTLICANMSRYSRDREHQSAIKREVRAAGARLVFCDMDFDDTPEGDLAFNVFGDFAEYDKASIRKRLNNGRVDRAGEGLQPSRRTPPYGYHIVTHADVIRETYAASEVGRYFLREDQAKVARWIWEVYHAGTHSLAGIARELTRQGVPTPGRASQWCMTTVRYILANPVYKGVAIYGRFDNVTDESRLLETHWRTGEPLKEPRRRTVADPDTWITMDCPALVSEDVWDAVQTRLVENKAKKGGNPQRVRMLAGRIFCPHCGQGLVCGSSRGRSRRGEKVDKPQRYCCSAYMKSVQKTGTPVCEPTGYYVQDVEASVTLALLDACQRPAAVREAIRVYAKPDPGAPGSAEQSRRELTAIDKALTALGGEEAATVQGQIAGIQAGASPTAYAGAFADIAARRKDLEDRRGSLSRRIHSERSQGKSVPALPTQALEQRAWKDAARVLSSPDVPGHVKRDALACLVESAVPSRAEGSPRTEMVTTVRFLPGVLEDEGEEGAETLQTIRLGSDSILALFSVMSALSWAANGRMRLRLPPPSGFPLTAPPPAGV